MNWLSPHDNSFWLGGKVTIAVDWGIKQQTNTKYTALWLIKATTAPYLHRWAEQDSSVAVSNNTHQGHHMAYILVLQQISTC